MRAATLPPAACGQRDAGIVTLARGIIAAPMGIAKFESNESVRKIFERSPLSSEGSMPEIANAVEFLSSERASLINCIDLQVDGGLVAALMSG